MSKPDIKRVALIILGGIGRVTQLGDTSSLRYRLKAPGWFAAAKYGSLFVVVALMFVAAALASGHRSWIGAVMGGGLLLLGLALIHLALVLRSRQ
ncbi:hypothetical protein OPKNFCMD_2468 [Methylobacterium crusticola]|uniref:Uncharacterized protein n=1 Tax=Methylobacterium crusticola TaxID=1697972 RepID=A0ABQ4QYD9_9HYPH|nr:hypothetical protein [Methylobacterium crusticola]GJD49735.1 hypothetical protein OPKNFCMD_2468 [Methylobacterium crusticola]